MRRVLVLLAPDCFTGTLSALEAAEALAAGWRRARPGDELVLQPLSDGGPGFLDALPGADVSVLVEDPLARPALGLRRPAAVQPGAVTGDDRYSRGGVFRRDGRRHARVLD